MAASLQMPTARRLPIRHVASGARHGEERTRHVPEQMAVDGQRDPECSGARQDDELPVAVRQPVEKFLEAQGDEAAMPSNSPRTSSTGDNTFSGCTTGKLAVMSR